MQCSPGHSLQPFASPVAAWPHLSCTVQWFATFFSNACIYSVCWLYVYECVGGHVAWCVCVCARARARARERVCVYVYCEGVCHSVWERERERERMNEWLNKWMNKLYFTRVVEKTRGLFTSSPRQWGKLLLTKDTMSYSMLSTCIFIQTMLKWTPVNRETSRLWEF